MLCNILYQLSRSNGIVHCYLGVTIRMQDRLWYVSDVFGWGGSCPVRSRRGGAKQPHQKYFLNTEQKRQLKALPSVLDAVGWAAGRASGL